MRRVVFLLAFVALGVVFGRIAFDRLAPNVLMQLALYKMTESSKATAAEQGLSIEQVHNVFFHAEPVTEELRTIVKPAPDLLYSGCLVSFEDNTEGVRVAAPPASDYASISIYAMNSDNIFFINDQDPRWSEDGLELILIPSGASRMPDAMRDVLVPIMGTHAIVLQRRILRDRDDLEALDAERRLAVCESF